MIIIILIFITIILLLLLLAHYSYSSHMEWLFCFDEVIILLIFRIDFN
jgi:hypothetical protein